MKEKSVDTTLDINERKRLIESNVSNFETYRQAFERQLRLMRSNLRNRRWWNLRKTRKNKDVFLDSHIDYTSTYGSVGINDVLAATSHMGSLGFYWGYNKATKAWTFLPRTGEQTSVVDLDLAPSLINKLLDAGINTVEDILGLFSFEVEVRAGVEFIEIVAIKSALTKVGFHWSGEDGR